MTSIAHPVLSMRGRRQFEYLRGFGLLLIIAFVGLYIVKWNPYYHRAFTAAAKHAIGASIVSGKSAAPPAVSWSAGLNYFEAYFKSIYQALILGLLMAATVQALVPRDWIARALGRAGARSSVLGALLALPCMMCTCCSAPLVVAARKSGASTLAAATFFIGSPTLNPAVLVFLFFTLGWQWAALRLVFGAALVAGSAFLAARLAGSELVLPQPELAVSLPADGRNIAVRWLDSFARLVVTLLPEYLVIVLLLGAFRAILFPGMIAHAGSNPVALVGLAVAGTLFMIPTAGEIPIIQTLQAFGLGAGAAGVLLMTLAPLSLPSLAMLSRSFPPRLLLALAGFTAVTGLVCGLAAVALRI